MLYNPEWLLSLPFEQQIGVVWHECVHVAFLHHLRIGKRNHRLWNIAADYAINWIGAHDGVSFPPDGLLSEEYANMSAEQIYEKLKQDIEEKGGSVPEGDNQGEGIPDGQGWGDVMPHPGEDAEGNPVDGEAEMQRIKHSVTAATMTAKKMGRLGANFARAYGELVDPKLDWRSILRNYVMQTFSDDYSWSKRNKRFRDVYLPSLKSDGLSNAVIAIDTSASITEKELTEYATEVNAMFDTYTCDIIVLYCDANINKVSRFTNADRPLKFDMVGGGGTRFEPVFRWVDINMTDQPSVLVYFTDMCGSFPKHDPGYPVLWVTKTQGYKAPFGSVVEVR